MSAKRKTKFHKGQVIAFRGSDGEWDYDAIGSMRVSDQSIWLARSTSRRNFSAVRPLTKRECGRAETQGKREAK